jgi:hypothetical protein
VAIEVDPKIDVSFAAARVFGNRDGRWGMPLDHGHGTIQRRLFGEIIFTENPVCPSTTFVRRGLFHQVGGFRDTRCEDYDFWTRALGRGARFHYDPTTLVHYRRHDSNVSSNMLAVHESNLMVRSRNRHLVTPRLARKLIAADLFSIGRDLSEIDRNEDARRFYRDSLKEHATAKAAAWVALSAAPPALRRPLAGGAVAVKRTLTGTRLRTQGP